MPRQCTICVHSERVAIDQVLVAGEPYRNIAARYGTSTGALVRHKTDHLPPHLAQAQEAEEIAQADGLLDQLLTLSRETTAILKEARQGKQKDNELALKAIGRAEKQIELQARLLGELKDGQTVNVLISPEWGQIRSVLLAALAPYPQARIAVATALQGIEGNGHSA